MNKENCALKLVDEIILKHGCLCSAVDSTRTSGSGRCSCQFKTDIWSKCYLVWTVLESRRGRISNWILFIPWPFVIWSQQFRAVPWFRWLGFGLSPRSSWFYPRPVYLRFMANKVTVGDYIVWGLQFSIISIFSTGVYVLSFFCPSNSQRP